MQNKNSADISSFSFLLKRQRNHKHCPAPRRILYFDITFVEEYDFFCDA